MDYTEWIELEEKVKVEQDAERFHHTLGVMYTAAALAMVYGVDLERARLAGLLHDCAKSCIPNGKKAEACDRHGIKISDFERVNPHLLHGKLGAYYARHKYGIEDEEICSAIACHTTGKPKMTLLEQIIYVADYIEPDRDEMPRLDKVRRTAFADIDLCTEMIMADILEHLKSSGRPIDTETNEAYEYYHQLILSRGRMDE